MATWILALLVPSLQLDHCLPCPVSDADVSPPDVSPPDIVRADVSRPAPAAATDAISTRVTLSVLKAMTILDILLARAGPLVLPFSRVQWDI